MTLENNRNIMVERLRAIPGVRVTKPDGTFYCFPDFSAYEKNSQKLSQLLLDKVRVVTVPGKEFGMEGHLRLSFCGGPKEIKEGHRAHSVGARPELGERAVSRQPQAGEGLGMTSAYRHPEPRRRRKRRSPRACSAWKITGSRACTGSTGT